MGMWDKAVNVTRPAMPPYEEYCAEIRSLWDSRRLTNAGEKHRGLQARLKEYLGAEHLELFTNGHMAIELSLQALRDPFILCHGFNLPSQPWPLYGPAA